MRLPIYLAPAATLWNARVALPEIAAIYKMSVTDTRAMLIEAQKNYPKFFPARQGRGLKLASGIPTTFVRRYARAVVHVRTAGAGKKAWATRLAKTRSAEKIKQDIVQVLEKRTRTTAN